MILDSNTLFVMLPPGMGLHAATSAFRRFGDVARLEVVPADVLTVTVSFYDVRAASRAMEMLGNDYAWPGEPTGSRTMRLPGDMQLSAEDYQRVSDVRRDPNDDGGYVVEFFDVRDAARVSAKCAKNAGKKGSAKASKKTEQPEPIYVTPCVGVSPPVAAKNEATHQSVLLQGLPSALCSEACVDAMLEQAGLQGAVMSRAIHRGSPCGEVVLRIAGQDVVERCIKHFHGRVWDPSGTPVSATRMAPPPGLRGASRTPPPSGLAKNAVVAPPPGLGGLSGTKERSNTEESTDAGESEAEEMDEYLGEVYSAVL